MKSVKEALNIDQKWTPEQAKNDIERYVLRSELPAVKAAALAVMALEKQIPQKLIPKINETVGDIWICCPNCLNAALTNIFNGKGFKYCPECGQALDWGE